MLQYLPFFSLGENSIASSCDCWISSISAVVRSYQVHF